MSNANIDIHQLDIDKQILFIVNEADVGKTIDEIESEFKNHRISTENINIGSRLDKRKMLRKKGYIALDHKKYQIMQKGKDYLSSTIICIDPAHEDYQAESISGILEKFSGTVRICDPYFDEQASQLLINHLSKKITSIEILCDKKCPIMEKTLNTIKRKRTVTIKKMPNNSKVHDRYIIDDKCLFFLGCSLNGIGKKQSFIFNLSIYQKIFLKHFEDNFSKATEISRP